MTKKKEKEAWDEVTDEFYQPAIYFFKHVVMSRAWQFNTHGLLLLFYTKHNSEAKYTNV